MLRDRLARRGARATLGVVLITAAFTLPAGAMRASNVQAPTPSGSEGSSSLPALPAGSADRGRAGVERSAIALAAALKAVPVDTAGAICGRDRLRVIWQTPGDTFTHGAYVEPV